MAQETVDILRRLSHAEHYFKGTKYATVLDKAQSQYRSGDYSAVGVTLGDLPDGLDMLEAMIEKMAGKPVYKSLMKITRGLIDSEAECLKAWSSLMTHTLIEVEHGNREYKILVEIIYEKIGKIIYGGY